MSALYLGTSGLTFGIPTTETGGIIQNLDIRLSREKASVRDNDGDTVAAAYYDPSEEITFDFVVSGATGVAAASPGVAVTVANYTPAAGIIIVEETTKSYKNTEYLSQSVKAMVHPAITS